MSECVDRHTGDGGALGVGGELDVIGRPETTVGHLHDPRLRIGRGGARLLLARLFGRWFPGFALRIRSRVLRRLPGRALGFLARRFLLFGVQFLGHRQRRPNPPLAILDRPPTRRGLPAAGGAGIGIKLRAQIVKRPSFSFVWRHLQWRHTTCGWRSRHFLMGLKWIVPTCYTQCAMSRP